MKHLKLVLTMALLMLVSGNMFASSHREAPITALDRGTDVTDWYAFVSHDHPDRVTMILNVDPLLEPGKRTELLSVRSQRALPDEDRQ
ncbi:MAG TPA: DUF4331 family protein [Candidatus Binatia bacterium]|nr:DUF4331 family protein [Candidatus Binatia bacterium]